MSKLFNRETLAGLTANDDVPGSGSFQWAGRMEGEISYGMPLFGGDLTGTPNLGFGLTDCSWREYRVVWRLISTAPG